jgi:N utilization substance protein A
MAVNNELGQEKIDIIEWSDEPEEFIGNALSPAKVESVEVLPRREARVFVAEDQLSLAIGRGGQNVRLAAKLTGWKIDVRSQSKPEEALADEASFDPNERLSDDLSEENVNAPEEKDPEEVAGIS